MRSLFKNYRKSKISHKRIKKGGTLSLRKNSVEEEKEKEKKKIVIKLKMFLFKLSEYEPNLVKNIFLTIVDFYGIDVFFKLYNWSQADTLKFNEQHIHMSLKYTTPSYYNDFTPYMLKKYDGRPITDIELFKKLEIHKFKKNGNINLIQLFGIFLSSFKSSRV